MIAQYNASQLLTMREVGVQGGRAAARRRRLLAAIMHAGCRRRHARRLQRGLCLASASQPRHCPTCPTHPAHGPALPAGGVARHPADTHAARPLLQHRAGRRVHHAADLQVGARAPPAALGGPVRTGAGRACAAVGRMARASQALTARGGSLPQGPAGRACCLPCAPPPSPTAQKPFCFQGRKLRIMKYEPNRRPALPAARLQPRVHLGGGGQAGGAAGRGARQVHRECPPLLRAPPASS